MRVTVVVFTFVVAVLSAAPPPSAKEILDSVRMLESRQQIDLEGQLRENEKVIPFHLTQTGPLIRYSFADPEEVLQLRLGENGSRLDLVTDTSVDKIPAEKLNEKIRGTGISYEDLALKFLYWENARVLGDETVRTRGCWKLNWSRHRTIHNIGTSLSGSTRRAARSCEWKLTTGTENL